MKAIYKEMLLNTIKHNSLFILMRDDGSTLTISYNKKSEQPYCIKFESCDIGMSWKDEQTFKELRFILLDWDAQINNVGVFQW